MWVSLKRIIPGAAILGLLFAAAPAPAQTGPSAGVGAPAVFAACPDPATAPEDVPTPCLAIVGFDPAVLQAERALIARGAGAVVRFNFSIVEAVAVLVPNPGAYWALAGDPDVTALTPDRRVYALKPPGGCDPWPDCKNGGGDDDGGGGGNQITPAGVSRIGADLVAETGNGVTAWIVDTGLDSDHPDLTGYAGGATCLGDSEGADVACAVDGGEDDNGHGTHVGGIVGAADNNGDVVGVAPDVALKSVKVLDSSGSGYDSNVIAGLDYIALNAADPDVVNMSLGRDGDCLDPETDPSADLIRGAIQALTNTRGIPVVVAAGNDSEAEVKDMVPAGCPEVMAVASTTAEDGNNKCRFLPDDILADTASFFTTDGSYDDSPSGVGVTISAPGETREDNTCGSIKSVGILSLAMGGGTSEKSGTSMAAPHVAGLVALMLEADNTLLPEDIRSIIRSTADRDGTTPLDHPYINESLDGEMEGIACAPDAVAGTDTGACSP